MGKIVDDDTIFGIILNGIPEEYSQVRLLAESRDDFDLNAAMETMRNMYGNRDAAKGLSDASSDGLSRTAKGRSSAMTASASAKFCSFCKKKGHTAEECWRKNKQPAGQALGSRRGDWCSIHKTSRHDNSNCREQQNRNTSGGGFRGRQQPGRHQGHLTHDHQYFNPDQQGGHDRNNSNNNFQRQQQLPLQRQQHLQRKQQPRAGWTSLSAGQHHEPR